MNAPPVLAIASCILAGLACVPSQSAYADTWRDVLDPYRVRTVYLQMSTSDWDRIRFDQPSQSESWVPEVASAWLNEEGMTPIQVAVRRKGESDPPLPDAGNPQKVSLKIDIDEYLPDQLWHDLQKLSLENGGEGLLHEGFAWIVNGLASQSGMYGYDAANSGWVLLYVNGDCKGVFLNAEQRDKRLLRNRDWYNPSCTWLYKIDGSAMLEVGNGDSPVHNKLGFAPLSEGNNPQVQPDLDAYLPQWINMRGMLTLGACEAFVENRDGLFTHSGKNSYAVDFNPPYPQTRRYLPWDLDTSFSAGTDSIYGNDPYQQQLLEHPWFGRVYEHILTELLDGVLSTASLYQAVSNLETALTPALNLDPYAYPGEVPSAFTDLRSWINVRCASVRSQLRHTHVPRPIFNQQGGEVVYGFGLTMSAPTGSVYYTFDGTDPRAPGGAPGATASLYTNGAPVPIEHTTYVRARAVAGTNWSGLETEAIFNLANYAGTMRMTEIMFNPVDTNGLDAWDAQAYEFVEFKNAGPALLDLSGFSTDGIYYTFPAGSTIPAGGFVVLVRNPSEFTNRYPGRSYFGVYSGSLGNDGEKIRLRNADGSTVISVDYDDDPPWQVATDGMGYSLVIVDPDGNPDDPSNWRASTLLLGSPGTNDPPPAYQAGVVINEVLAHSDSPYEDAIELFNPTASNAVIGGWFLSDDARDSNGIPAAGILKKYRIPDGITITAGTYRVFYQKQFDSDNTSGVSFSLTEYGETVYLAAATPSGDLLGHVVSMEFGAQDNLISVGRIQTSVGTDIALLEDKTFGVSNPGNPSEFRQGNGAANSPPRVGPIVFSEIMYNPGPEQAEFLELRNITTSNVDLSGWLLTGASIMFPTGTVIDAGSYLVLFDSNRFTEAAFRTSNSVPAGVPIIGISMDLGNAGETLSLSRPNPDTNAPPLLVERVRFNDRSPWPTEADGEGPSLERLDTTAYGNDPANWRVGIPNGTPGSPASLQSGLAVTSYSGWKYKTTASSLGTAWRETNYQDSAWLDGDGVFGYGEPYIDTLVSYGPASTNKYMTTYFRKTFTLSEPPSALTVLTFGFLYDDGFVAYINGQEMVRRGLTNLVVQHETPAGPHEAGAYETTHVIDYIPYLRQGANVLAVEVHQDQPAGEDLVWDAYLTYSTEQQAVDDDGDGLPDDWELLHFGSTNAATGGPTDDPDSDSVRNRDEYVAGTLPTDFTSKPLISGVLREGSSVYVTVPTAAQRQYAIDFRTNIASGAWLSLFAGTTGTGTNQTWVDNPSDPVRFYRMRVVLP